jgi:hypothetical protein
MNETKRGTLKGYFAPAARPNATQFEEFIDSLVHLNDANNGNVEFGGSISLGDRLPGDLRPLKAGTIKWNGVTSKFQASFDGVTFVDFGGGASGNPLTIGNATIGTPTAGPMTTAAVFAETTRFNTNQFALAQTLGGVTILNAATSIQFQNAGTTRMAFLNGVLTIGANPGVATSLLDVWGDARKIGVAWGAISDERVKKNVKAFTEGIEPIRKLRIVKFQYNGKGNTPKDMESVGVIAQEAKEVLPESVTSYKAKLNEDDENETELLSFNASSLFYNMINAIKELDQRLADLESKTKSKK